MLAHTLFISISLSHAPISMLTHSPNAYTHKHHQTFTLTLTHSPTQSLSLTLMPLFLSLLCGCHLISLSLSSSHSFNFLPGANRCQRVFVVPANDPTIPVEDFKLFSSSWCWSQPKNIFSSCYKCRDEVGLR